MGINNESLAQRIFVGVISALILPMDVYLFNSKKIVSAIYRGYKKDITEIDYNSPDFAMLNDLRENAYMFSAAKTFQQTLEMTTKLRDGNRVVPYAEFKKEVAKISDIYNEDYLKAEYETAISSAQSASAWQRYEKEKGVLPRLRYSTIGDACPICGPLNGLTGNVGDSIWNQIMPPNHFFCKCLLEQEEESYQLTPADEKEKLYDDAVKLMDPTFRQNVGKSGKSFDKKHPYFRVPEKYKEFAKRNFDLPIPEAKRKAA